MAEKYPGIKTGNTIKAADMETALNRKIEKSGDTMTGTLIGAAKFNANRLATFSEGNTAFFVLPANAPTGLNNPVQGVLSWRTGLDGGGYSIYNIPDNNKDITVLAYATSTQIYGGSNSTPKPLITLTDGYINFDVSPSVPSKNTVAADNSTAIATEAQVKRVADSKVSTTGGTMTGALYVMTPTLPTT